MEHLAAAIAPHLWQGQQEQARLHHPPHRLRPGLRRAPEPAEKPHPCLLRSSSPPPPLRQVALSSAWRSCGSDTSRSTSMDVNFDVQVSQPPSVRPRPSPALTRLSLSSLS